MILAFSYIRAHACFVRKVLFLLIFFTLESFQSSVNTNAARNILNDMCEAISKVRTAEYKLHTTERVEGHFDDIYSEIKVNTKPRKIYLINRKKKLEVLYNEGENNGKAYVNPGKFPYITLSLDPYGNLMRDNQHHSIDDLGFHYIADLLRNACQLDNKPYFDKTVKYDGIVQWEGTNCYKLFFNFPDFKYVNYTATNDENLRAIARKFNCGEYRIVEKNSGIDFDDIIKKGTTIKVPNMYAKITLIYIQTETNLPVSIKVMDNEGMYEQFELRDIKINKGFAKNEFTKDFPSYSFK